MDSRVNDEAAFILHRRDYQNNSLIIELFTRRYGRINALVKGAKKRKDISSFQVGNRLSLCWTGRSELKTITQVDCRNIPIPVKSLYALFYINELLLVFFAKGDEHANVFEAYQRFIIELSHLDSNDVKTYQPLLESLLRNFELDLLGELGYLPALDTDSVSGEKISPEREYQFNGDSGVSITSAEDNDLGVISGKALIAISQRDFSSTSKLKSAKMLLRKIIDFHLQGRTLQSRTLYQKFNRINN